MSSSAYGAGDFHVAFRNVTVTVLRTLLKMSDIPKISPLTVSTLIFHRAFVGLRVEAVPALLIKRLFACAGIGNSESHASGVNEAFRIAILLLSFLCSIHFLSHFGSYRDPENRPVSLIIGWEKFSEVDRGIETMGKKRGPHV